MKIYLASTNSKGYLDNIKDIKYILESFYNLNKNTLERILKKDRAHFLLDSGAFTFMNSHKGYIDFDEYLDRYINFINKYDIKYFFELDIDSIVGYKKVLEYRKKLEERTNKKCIPVWHKSRGLDDFINTAKKYDYMAIGGIVTKEIRRNQYIYLKKLIEIAHKNNCKIHGLGFTNTKILHQYHFDSVDSSSWTSGSRFASIYYFNGKYIETNKNKNKRLKNYRLLDKYNLHQWNLFVNYAEKHL